MASLGRFGSALPSEVKAEIASPPLPPSTKLIIVSNRELTAAESASFQQHGTLVVLNPCDLPPISIPIENLFSRPVSFLILNMSVPTVRYWAQARVDLLSAIPHIVLRGTG
jgi:hypothetical protein